MTRYGRYDAANPAHGSALFAYGEVPLESAKFNRWNGNIAAVFAALTRALTRALGVVGEPVLLGGATALRVVAQDPPDRTIRVLPGLALWAETVAGSDAAETLPALGELGPPAAQPRIDAVYLTPAGYLIVATGEESAAPSPPALPSDALPLARIHWRVAAAAVHDADDGVNAWIADARPPLLVARGHDHAADHAPPQTPDGARVAFSTARCCKSARLWTRPATDTVTSSRPPPPPAR